LVNYLQNVVNGTVLIGVTSNKATGNLSAAALSALTGLGVSVGDVQQGGSFAFVAQVGYINKTVMKKSLSRLGTAAILNVVLHGKFSATIDASVVVQVSQNSAAMRKVSFEISAERHHRYNTVYISMEHHDLRVPVIPKRLNRWANKIA
jgi:Interleukin-like EMT inducer